MEEAILPFTLATMRSGNFGGSKAKFEQFQKNGNTEDIFKCIYNMEEAHKLLKLNVTDNQKDQQQSIKLREEGNIFYQGKQLKEALEKYNESIFTAPHPKLSCEKIVKKEYEPLALAYENRSAVLFDLKEYSLCICDIDRSLNLCDSKKTQIKLEIRKGNCLIAIEKYDKAQELLRTCKIKLNSLQIKREVKESFEDSLSKLLLQCVQGIKSDTYQHKTQHKSRYEEIKSADAQISFSSDDLIFAYNNPTAPCLDDYNPNIPAFSSALKLQYSPDQGRYVVATRDIKPGDVIAVEKPYASCIYPEEPISPKCFCTFCFKRTSAPLPCFECTNVVFCNEECRSKGWDSFHKIECPVFSQLQQLGKVFIQAYRIIAGQSFDELKESVSRFQEEEQNSPIEQIFNEDQICDSDSYRSIYYLKENIKTMDTIELWDFSLGAFMINQLLIQSKRYFHINREDNKPNKEDVIFTGSLFIQHILGIWCNYFGIQETHVITSINRNNIDNESVFVGYGTYIGLSQFNHSCIPSAIVFYYGNVGVCRASSFIPSGSQVYVSYDFELDRTIRRANLLDHYLFNCNCHLCASDVRMLSFNVNQVFTDSRIRAKDRRVARIKFERTVSLKAELVILLKKNRSMYMKLKSRSSDVRNYLDLVLETIDFFDRFCVMPDQSYFVVQSFFEMIFGMESSCYFVI